VGVLKEVERDGSALLLDRSGTGDVSVHQLIKLAASDSREELELRTEGGLEDGEALGESVRIGHDKLITVRSDLIRLNCLNERRIFGAAVRSKSVL
jgi:hypothetical protein